MRKKFGGTYMKPLRAIVTFHLVDGRRIVDEDMILKTINEELISFISGKRISAAKESIDFATVSMLYGNSSRILFSVEAKEITSVHEITDEYIARTYCVFSAPETKAVCLGNEKIEIRCASYDKLRAMVKPRTGKAA